MIIAFSSAPFGRPGSDDFRQIGTVEPAPTAGYSIVKWGPTAANGTVPPNPTMLLGLSPDGIYSEADPVTGLGNGQQFKLVNGSLVIRPNVSVNDGSVLVPGAPTVAYVIACRVLA
jgi:hypothetical protein